MFPGAQGRGICQPPQELSALQLVGGPSRPPQQVSDRRGENTNKLSKSGRDSSSAFLVKIQQH